MLERWFIFGNEKSPLESEKVGFAYQNSKVLRDVSLKLKKGEILAIIGKSGSGKSTFLKLVAGIIGKKYDGKIKVFGMPKVLKKEKIGFVPQESALIPDLSLEDNIRTIGLALGVSERKALKNAEVLMKQLMVREPLIKKPIELSGGQRARFNIVCSVLHDPDILVMDEPFTGLDYKNRRLLWHFLESMQKRKKSIVLTSHLLREIEENADRIVILRNGKIFFSGDLERLKKKLGIGFILEMKLSKLNKKNYAELKKYCIVKDIKLLDYYGNYVMFGISSSKIRTMLEKKLSKLNVGFVEVGFREPNLDEIFMSP